MPLFEINRPEDLARLPLSLPPSRTRARANADTIKERNDDGRIEAYLVLVQAPWCPYCQIIRKEWSALTDILRRDVPQLHIVEFDRQVVEDARRSGNVLIEAMDARDPVSTVPRVSLVLSLRERDGDKTDKEKRTTSFEYDDYFGDETTRGNYRSREHLLHFIRDTIRNAKNDR